MKNNIRPFNEEERKRSYEREYRNRSETFDTRLNREIRDRSINRDSRDDLYNDDLGIFDCDQSMVLLMLENLIYRLSGVVIGLVMFIGGVTIILHVGNFLLELI